MDHFNFQFFLKIISPLPLNQETGTSTPTALVDTLLYPLLYSQFHLKKKKAEVKVTRIKKESIPLTGSLDAPRVRYKLRECGTPKDVPDLYCEYRETREDVHLVLSILDVWTTSLKPVPLELLFLCLDLVPDLLAVPLSETAFDEKENVIEVSGRLDTPKCEENEKDSFTRDTGTGAFILREVLGGVSE